MEHKKLNKIIKIIIYSVIFIGMFLMLSLSTVNANDTEEVSVKFIEETEQLIEEPDIYEIKQKEILHRQKELLNIQDNKEYFLEYKKLINEYSEWFDPPENIYDYYTEEELDLLFRTVEAEATAGGFNEKANVASVIFNRIEHEKFGVTLGEVLVAHQFSPLADGRADGITITEDTILACEYVFQIADTTGGAIYFESKDSNVHAAYSEFLFQDDIGHKFYKEAITDGE